MAVINFLLVNSSNLVVGANITREDGMVGNVPIGSLIGMKFKNAVVMRNGVVRAKSGTLERRKIAKEYHILNKDTVIASFDENMNLYQRGILPLGFGNINDWLQKRAKFSCARDVTAFFASIGISGILDYAEITHCVSLADSFWVKSVDSKLHWKDVSPFRNDYSKVISAYALEGSFLGQDKNYLSPDISTNGTFPHTWKINNGDITFVKAGSRYTLGGRNSGQEPFSEYYASIIGRFLGFYQVEYTIRNHRRLDARLDVVTDCKCYTSEAHGSVTAAKLGLASYEDVLAYSKSLDDKSFKTNLDMYFLDCLLLNTDRHFSNIEYFIDNTTQKVITMTPIYDNNYSMLPRFLEELDVFDRNDYRTAVGMPFETLYGIVRQYKSYKRELLRLKSLNLEKPKSVAMSDSRITFLNKFLQEQVDYLLSL